MAKKTITYDDDLQEVILLTFPSIEIKTVSVAELSDHFGYPLTVPGEPDGDGTPTTIPNPQSRVYFAKQAIRRMLGDIVEPRMVKAKTDEIVAQVRAALEPTVVS